MVAEGLWEIFSIKLFKDLILLNEKFAYYLLITLNSILFLLSINFNIKKSYDHFKRITNLFLKK